MDVVTNSGAVRSFPLVTKYLQYWELAYGDLKTVVRDRIND